VALQRGSTRASIIRGHHSTSSAMLNADAASTLKIQDITRGTGESDEAFSDVGDLDTRGHIADKFSFNNSPKA
ncbi:MAG: hypothetical protein Q9204_007632, partial [Flavoplaca sp. TL-2023a]